MKDQIIKQNAKSRIIKASTSGTFPTTYGSFRTAITEGNVFADITVNEAGCDEVGTPLNKANLLSDDTATALGLDTETATVNLALAALDSAIDDLVELIAEMKIKAGDTLEISSSIQSGFISNSGKSIFFNIPTGKIMEAESVSVSNMTVKLRQGGNYVGGSNDGVDISTIFSTMTYSVNPDGSILVIGENTSVPTNAVNNDVISVEITSANFTFS